MKKITIIGFLFFLLTSTAVPVSKEIVVGSKTFTESVILGEIIKQLVEQSGKQTKHLSGLGGTRVLWNSLNKGEVDIYPEYTGTLIQEIFSGRKIEGIDQLRQELGKYGIGMTAPLGFNNTYILGMKKTPAAKLKITKISDLKKHPDLRIGFSSEFMERADGWPGLKKAYNLTHKNVTGLDHNLAYRGVSGGSIDLIDLYSTDAEIDYYSLATLEDDLNYFPNYYAVILYRKYLIKEHPSVIKRLSELESKIPEQVMIKMNSDVKIGGLSESLVAADYINKTFFVTINPAEATIFSRFSKNTFDHLILVGISLFFAILISIPLGIIAYKNESIGKVVLGVVGIIQTIPSIALLVFMIPLLGIGFLPAVVALFLYSLLPIVRNTYSGLKDVPGEIKESAEAIGLPDSARLRLVELPIASRSILSGIKTSAVINVGTATLAALIGAGGYGQPIFTGIRLDNIGLILEGAIPAAVLALLVQALFGLLEKVFVPRGLRLNS
ncbi:MAG: ABC transporter permease subunit [Candidatus Dadabacteria bacterium]|nr:ABC transporter permease subunit [Candidatus Dadabacteria bacterium]NIS09540.1 ABC transporter permease subunit [Candidatus Dadabacteria bacterium]NIV42752.1 ABC transporter permease subunit [Candidatus Dadabacteria bacterium]NIX16646.1 ABC transporter permease subunit [Candidatus Dadabacteria bacterium]NIY23187.1 ABC transporter permease subunit [Candidatus Dadabacteria bacterium]